MVPFREGTVAVYQVLAYQKDKIMIHRITLSLSLILSSALTMTGNAFAEPQDQASAVAAAASAAIPDDAWRTVDPENLLIIETKYGDIGVELYPEIAPKHVTQIKALTRQGFYNDVPFHRVIKGFMNQTGDGSKGDGTGDSELPDIKPEFDFQRQANMHFYPITKQNIDNSYIGVGFYKALPIASQPTVDSFIKKVDTAYAFGLHCKGVTSMARTADPNSANSQFFLMRGKSESLDKKYSIWGSTVMGYEFLEKPLVGTVSDDPEWIPDRMDVVTIAADMPEGERPKVQVLRTDHAAFKGWLETQKKANGTFPDICDLSVPTRKF